MKFVQVQHSVLNTRDFLINLFYAKLFLTAKLSIDENIIAIGIANEIHRNLYNENALIRAFCLNVIEYLNFDKYGYSKHCLYITEDLEISEKGYALVQVLTDDCNRCVRQCLHSVLKDVFVANFDSFLKSEESRLPALLVLRYYPCIVSVLCGTEDLFDYFLSLNVCDSEECITAVIGCMDSVLRTCELSTLKEMKFERVLKFLLESCATTAAVHRRLAVCHLLLFNKLLYISPEIYSSGKCYRCLNYLPFVICFVVVVKDFCDVWDMILILLEDDDPLIRNGASKLKTKVDPNIKVL